MDRKAVKTKLISSLLAAVIFLVNFNFLPIQSIVSESSYESSITAYAATTKPGTWIKESNGKWWYKHTDGTYTKNGWEYINGYWYHFDASGYMQTGWLKVDGKWYHLNSEGKMHIGWVKIGNYWYHFDSNGVRQTGWQQLNGNWYYFNSDGIRQVGWQQVDGKWYHLNSNGIMETGWVKIGTDWYFFHSTGERYVGWLPENGKTYHFNSSGIMDIGWKKINGYWYFFNTDGSMQTGWKEINSKWYHFNSGGVMDIGWKKINNYWYFFNTDGSMQLGWKKIDSKWYYFNPDSGKMRIQQLFDGSTTFTFALSGELYQTQLGVAYSFQHGAYLCWAACAQMVGPYGMNFSITQEEIVEQVKGRFKDEGASTEETIEALTIASNYTKNAEERVPLDFSQVIAKIDAKKPFILHLDYSNSIIGHAVVCAGYNLQDRSVYIINPSLGSPNEYYDYLKLLDNITINNMEGKCTYMYIY